MAVVLLREVSERRDWVVAGGRDCIDTAQMVTHELVIHRRDGVDVELDPRVKPRRETRRTETDSVGKFP